MLKFTVVFSVLLVCACADIDVYNLHKVPAKYEGEEGCYIPDLDKMLREGKIISSHNPCKQYQCLEDGIQVITCSKLKVKDNKQLESRYKDKPYPLCCPIADAS